VDRVFDWAQAGAEDVGRGATSLLANTDKPHQNAYDLIGEVPAVSEMASILTTVLDRPIRYVEITDGQWAQAVRERINPHALDHLSHLWRFFRTSRLHKGESGLRVTTDTIRALTGTAPPTLEQFFRRDAEATSDIGHKG
jgi:uncharacterized protein YbjT (DUF2867 family)